MTKGSVGILVDDPTIGTEGQLPPLTSNCQRLSHQTSMSVEVRQQVLPVCTTRVLWRHYAERLGGSAPEKVDNAVGRYLVRLSSVYNGTHPSF